MSGQKLSRSITSPQYFALAFGSVVGVAWIVVLGPLIGQAGPVGSALAMGAGGLVILLVAFCYAEMAGLRPAAGGELVYAFELYGPGACYAVGWTLALLYVGTCVFEAISMGVVADQLFPGAKGPLLYKVFGSEVRLGAVLIGIGVSLALWVINVVGTHLTARTQEWVTYLRLALMIGFLAVAVRFADPANLKPIFGPITNGGILPFLVVLSTAPFIFGGFSTFATATEESHEGSSMRKVGRAVVLSIIAAALFYVVLIMTVGALVPRPALLKMDLPTAQAFLPATGSPLVTRIVLATAVLGNLTAWNGLLIAGARVLFALGRANLSAPGFGHVHPRWRTPSTAIGFISIIGIAGLFLGRGFILPIVNVTSACFALTYLVTAAAVLRLRRTEPEAPRAYKVPGGRLTAWIALVASFAILAVALIQPYLAAPGTIPSEWWVVLGWTGLGLVIWLVTWGLRRKTTRAEMWLRLTGK